MSNTSFISFAQSFAKKLYIYIDSFCNFVILLIPENGSNFNLFFFPMENHLGSFHAKVIVDSK